MLRLFAALPVPEDVADALILTQKNLTGASWRPVRNFHVTLRFFGEVENGLAMALDEEIASISPPHIQIAIDGVGWFGRREPRSVWARVRATDGLAELSGACERAARRVGLPPEKRRFTPHITLAYCHGTPLSDAMAWTERHQALAAGPWMADRFHMYSSHLGRGPSIYTAEADYPLR